MLFHFELVQYIWNKCWSGRKRVFKSVVLKDKGLSPGRRRFSVDLNGIGAMIKAPGGKVTARGTSHIYTAIKNRIGPSLIRRAFASSKGLYLIWNRLSIAPTGIALSRNSRHSCCAKHIPTLPNSAARKRVASMKDVAVTYDCRIGARLPVAIWPCKTAKRK